MSLTHQDVIELLREKQGERSLRGFARALGVSAQYLSDVYRRQRTPGPKLLKKLGLRRHENRTVTFVKETKRG